MTAVVVAVAAVGVAAVALLLLLSLRAAAVVTGRPPFQCRRSEPLTFELAFSFLFVSASQMKRSRAVGVNAGQTVASRLASFPKPCKFKLAANRKELRTLAPATTA